MKLIICEKPNLALNVARAIGLLGEKNDGFFKCKDNYVVTFAFGHLLGLVEPRYYEENVNKKWTEYKLPFIPKEYILDIKRDAKGNIDSGSKKQLGIIKKLSKEADTIINCGDADREGQLIIDNIINNIKYKGRVLRLWLPEQTEAGIRKGLKEMKDNREYINLFHTGSSRAKMDYLFGHNTTLYLTKASGSLLNSGRVLIPIVKFIYDRDKDIKNFVPEDYYTVEAKSEKFTLKYKSNFSSMNDAFTKAIELNQHNAKVVDIENNKVKKQASKLFSLSTLQARLSKKYKISFQESLPIIQSLYEKGYVTYPRTNTEYLAEKESKNISVIITLLNEQGHKLVNKKKKSIYDDSKIESHSAITPTRKLATKEHLNDKEFIVYQTILNRFLANFSEEETIINERIIKMMVGENEFILKGNTIESQGFYKYEPKEIKDELPNFNIGEEFKLEFEVEKKKTQAPNLLSESDLSNLLKNPFRSELKEVNDDSEEYKALLSGIEIGTEATRTGIISNAIRYNYIKKEKERFQITDKGIYFIELLDKLNINLYKEKSVEINKKLKQVYKGELTEEKLLKDIEIELRKICSNNQEVDKIEAIDNSLGKCPECSSKVYENNKAYSCSNKECRFYIFKENNFFTFRNARLTRKNVENLLNNKDTGIIKFKTKNGKEYKAKGIYKGLNAKGYVDFEIKFYNKK